ncbi:hypothetical protein ITI46_31610 [Streptomyces oryzae]|uniref:Uncharacterized protein n=1 Tax=Streptomyces oryzae TaxID=1434886 RepID=A0ABS3XLE7_9ACTN|nr:hypothetical protein [Streptomyces oryzae]MBO8196156.1 hypothetical protein [Streptomyces oryzae]
MTSPTPFAPAELTDREVILILQELTEELTAGAAADAMPLDQEEAVLLLDALLGTRPEAGAKAATVPEGAAACAAARRLLAVLAEEPACADLAAELLNDPPDDSRLGGELAVSGVVVLAATAAWLQTKIDIHFKRGGGQTEFEFRLGKEAADGSTLRELAAAVARLLGGPRE